MEDKMIKNVRIFYKEQINPIRRYKYYLPEINILVDVEEIDYSNQMMVTYKVDGLLFYEKLDLNRLSESSLLIPDGETYELFEGDIIRINNLRTVFTRGEPEFEYKIFQVIKNQYIFAFNNILLYMPLSGYNTDNGEMYEIELLGNIYLTDEYDKILFSK